jgi:membrane protease YdiL (CAAX protease family)
MTKTKQQFAAIAFTFEAGLAFLAILVGRGLGFDPLQKLVFDRPIDQIAAACLWGAAAAIPLLIGLVILDRLPGVLAEFKQRVSSVVLPMFEGLTLVEVAAISAAAGFGEEMLFRGLVQGGLQAWLDQPFGWVLAIAIASVVFGICHWLNATYAVLATGVGVYLGALFLFTDDLTAPIITHGLYDFAAIIYLTRVARRPLQPSPPPDDER